MATPYRRDASTVGNILLPRLPPSQPKDWTDKQSFKWAKDLLRCLDQFYDIVHRIQDNGTDQPLRAKLNFVGASVTDSLTDDTISVSIGGGAGAAPVNATYICVSLNGTLTNERSFSNGTGITHTDNGANNTFVVSLDTSNTRNVDHASVTLTAGTGLSGGGDITVSRTFNLANTAVTPSSYGDSTHVSTFTVDQQGRLTAASNTLISPSVSRFAWVGDTAKSNLSATLTQYLTVTGSATPDNTEQNVNIFVGNSYTIQRLHVDLVSAPGTGTSYAFTLRKNAADTALTCTIADSATAGSDNTHTVSVVDGDSLDIKVVPTSTPSATPAHVYIEVVPA